MHTPEGARLAELYDVVPNPFQPELVSYDLALAIVGVFDHRRMSLDRIVAEGASWRALPESHVASLAGEMVQRMEETISSVQAPSGISEGLVDRLVWNADRLARGLEISTPRRALVFRSSR